MRLLQLLIFTLPWAVLPRAHDPFWQPKELVWLAGCWVLILTTLTRYPLVGSTWNNRWAGWFGAWVLASGLAVFYWPYISYPAGAREIPFAIHVWLPTVYVLTGLVTIWVLRTYYCTSLASVLALTRWSCYAAVSVAAYALLQRVGADEFFRVDLRFAGQTGWPAHSMHTAFGNQQLTALYLSAHLPLFWVFRERRFLAGLALVALAVALVPCTFTRLAGLGGLAAYGWVRWERRQPSRARWSLLGVGVAGLLLLPWAVDRVQRDERWPVWQETIQLWQQRPITGYGLQSFPAYFHAGKAKRWSVQQVGKEAGWLHPHNEALKVLFELGVPGLVLLLGALWTVLGTAWMNRHTVLGAAWASSGIAVLLGSLAGFPWHLAPTAFTGMLIVAVLAAPLRTHGATG